MTKRYDDNTTVLVDFISPRMDRIFVFDLPAYIGLATGEDLGYLKDIGFKIMGLLSESQSIALSVSRWEVNINIR